MFTTALNEQKTIPEAKLATQRFKKFFLIIYPRLQSQEGEKLGSEPRPCIPAVDFLILNPVSYFVSELISRNNQSSPGDLYPKL